MHDIVIEWDPTDKCCLLIERGMLIKQRDTLLKALKAVREYPWHKGFGEEEVECRFCGAYIPRSEDGDVPVYKYHHDSDCPVHDIEAAIASAEHG